MRTADGACGCDWSSWCGLRHALSVWNIFQNLRVGRHSRASAERKSVTTAPMPRALAGACGVQIGSAEQGNSVARQMGGIRSSNAATATRSRRARGMGASVIISRAFCGLRGDGEPCAQGQSTENRLRDLGDVFCICQIGLALCLECPRTQSPAECVDAPHPVSSAQKKIRPSLPWQPQREYQNRGEPLRAWLCDSVLRQPRQPMVKGNAGLARQAASSARADRLGSATSLCRGSDRRVGGPDGRRCSIQLSSRFPHQTSARNLFPCAASSCASTRGKTSPRPAVSSAYGRERGYIL